MRLAVKDKISIIVTKLTFLIACAYLPHASAETIKLIHISDGNATYAEGLVKLALSYSDHEHAFEYENETIFVPRQIEYVNEGRLSIFWAATTPEYEETMRAVRIPLYRGLMGYRVLMIRKGEQRKFDHIKSLEDLNSISIGQGTHWSDTKILEANGVKITKTLKYRNLFPMLDGGRFDALPRGIHEPWGEIRRHPELQLDVEKNIALVYKMPYYLFVNKDNIQLANELEHGLNKAIEDGSFERYFFSNPTVKQALENSDLKNRLLIYLNNPFLTAQTPLDRPELWLNPTELPDLPSNSDR